MMPRAQCRSAVPGRCHGAACLTGIDPHCGREMEPKSNPRESPRDEFDPLVCAVACRRGREIPHEKVEELLAAALERSGGKITPAVLSPSASSLTSTCRCRPTPATQYSGASKPLPIRATSAATTSLRSSVRAAAARITRRWFANATSRR